MATEKIAFSSDCTGHSMLHHCNLDRLAAMWSIIHYGSTVQTIPYQSSGLFATPQGEEITADSPLKPFYQKDGKSFHTSRSVLDISDFGYTYPEFEDLDGSDPYQNSRHMIEIVNDLYGSILPPAVKRPHQKAWHVEGTTKDWVVFIEVERSELEIPCTINVYMRDKYAGRTTLLNMPMHGLLSDEIPLTQAVNASEFKGMPADAIEDQLEEGLRFEIKKVRTLSHMLYHPLYWVVILHWVRHGGHNTRSAVLHDQQGFL